MAEEKSTAPKRQHKATYAKDKRNGGYLVRVIGPQSNAFAGRSVPVTRRDDSEEMEKLVAVIWTGIDNGTDANPGTGKPVTLYSFEAKPKDDMDVAF